MLLPNWSVSMQVYLSGPSQIQKEDQTDTLFPVYGAIPGASQPWTFLGAVYARDTQTLVNYLEKQQSSLLSYPLLFQEP